MTDKPKLKSMTDLHSAIAGLAAHYIPRNEIRDHFTPEELRGVQKKPSYKITEEQRGVVEAILLNIVERKLKTVKGKERTANASESIVKAAGEDLPAMLRNDAENYDNLIHLHPKKIRRFVTQAKEIVMNYLETNQKRLQKYGVDDAIAAVSKLDSGLENRVIGACRKEIRALESEVRAEVRDAGQAWGRVGTLERKNDRLERQKERLKTKKEELERAVAALTAEQEPQPERVPVAPSEEPRGEQPQASAEQLSRISSLEEDNTVLEKDKRGLQIDLNQTLEYNGAEVKGLQEQLMRAQRDLNTARSEQDSKRAALLNDIEGLHEQLIEANEDIFELSEKSARLETEKDEEIENRTQLEEAFNALYDQYRARFTELGDNVAEWYAFAETMFLQNKDLRENEQLKGLRDKNTQLAALVTDMLEEVKSGKRLVEGEMQDINAHWYEQEGASLPTLGETEGKYKEVLAKVNAEHQREIWGYMHALYENNAPIELKQGVYERFLATNPKDNLIRCVAHNNLGNIFYKHKGDYKSAKVHYERAIADVNQELAQNPESNDAAVKLKEARANLALCKEKLAA